MNLNGRLFSLKTPLVMGILNATPDSFYDGGRYNDDGAVLKRAEKLLHDGADILDLGVVSTRPGSVEISENEEVEKVARLVRMIHGRFPEFPVSVDTWRASVAEAAVGEGASMINDISGGAFDAAMIPAVGRLQVPYCLMHTPAAPKVMQQHTDYKDILAEMLQFFGRQLERLHAACVHDIFIDPGFGFGKTLEQNYFLMNNLEVFHVFGLPLLVGISRKSMIYKLLGKTPEGALNGTTALNTVALMKGAAVLRVHDVAEAKEAVSVVQRIKNARA